MSGFYTTNQLCLSGQHPPTEVCFRSGGLFATIEVDPHHRVTLSGNPQEVRDFLNSWLGQVDMTLDELSPCERRGGHRWSEDDDPADRCCLDCELKEPERSLLVGAASVPF